MAQLMCEELCVGYDGKAVLKDLNFEVAAGDYLCIVGANGSGKSTLMKTIIGLQPPVSGSVIMGDGLQRKEISYLPQQTAVQTDFPASVPGAMRRPAFLYQKREAACVGIHGENADFPAVETLLSNTFRWAAATGAAGTRVVRRTENTTFRRACFRP